MKPATQPGADFTPIGLTDTFLSRVQHAAILDINEEGITATMPPITHRKSLAVSTESPPITFNRPFLFAIQDVPTGAILFLGVIEDPRG